MPSKIESSLDPAMLQEFFKRCAQLKGTKLKDIQALASEFGIDISLMSATTFRDGAFARHLEKIQRSKEKIEQLQALMADGTDTIDAALKVTADDLFDKITSGDEVDPLDTSLIISRLMKSRAVKDTVGQNAVKLEADLKLRDQQIAKLQRDQTDWEDKRAKISAQLDKVRAATPATADEVRAAAVAEIDRIMGIKTK